MALSSCEVERFLRDRLHISFDSSDVTKNDSNAELSRCDVISVCNKARLAGGGRNKLALLERLIVAYHANIPFQNVTTIAVAPLQQRAPSWEQIKDDVLSGRGGLLFLLPVLVF